MFLSETNFCDCSFNVYLTGHTSRAVSSSPSTESLSVGRDHVMSSPPLLVSKSRDSSTSSPPPSATMKDTFFNISRSRSHSKTINKKDAVSMFTFQLYHLHSQTLILCLFFYFQIACELLGYHVLALFNHSYNVC